MPPKRIRTTEGSCWPCKQRRVKCDLQRPSCRHCAGSGAKCNYDRVLLKWDPRPRRKLKSPSIFPERLKFEAAPPHLTSPFASPDPSLATNELRAIEYFQGRVWPLFSVTTTPCPPPLEFAFRNRSVLLAVCVLADSHRILHDRRTSRELIRAKRTSCLSEVRRQLAGGSMPSVTLLVAVLLLYFSDGYIDCTQESASTSSHHAGVRAIIDSQGGLPAIITGGDRSIRLLVSEFATTDVTNALLHGCAPSFPASIWDFMDGNTGSTWWEQPALGTPSLASVLKTMSEMASYLASHRAGLGTLSMETITAFELALRPSYATLTSASLVDLEAPCEDDDDDAIPSHALHRAFQHSATIYLHRAICSLPSSHLLVRQHVQSCLDCIAGMPRTSRAINCSLFPLYVAGAHAFRDGHRKIVLETLDVIFENIRFDAVNSIRESLRGIWEWEGKMDRSWTDMFRGLGRQTLVL